MKSERRHGDHEGGTQRWLEHDFQQSPAQSVTFESEWGLDCQVERISRGDVVEAPDLKDLDQVMLMGECEKATHADEP